MLASVRSRLLLPIIGVALPLVVMGSAVTWQNYRLASRQALDNVQLLRQTAVAQYQAAVEGAGQLLGALALAPVVRDGAGAGCDAYLRAVLAARGERYSGASVFGLDGVRLCTAFPATGGTPPTYHDVPWFRAGLESGGQRVGPPMRGPVSGALILPVTQVMRDGAGQLSGLAMLGLRLDWLTRHGGGESGDLTTWLSDGDGLLGAAERDRDALPPPDVLARLQDTDLALAADLVAGRPYSYASAALAPGLRLIVAHRKSAEAADAGSVLLTRMAILAVLLGIGLLAVIIGADSAVVAPIRRLNLAVRRWRAGGVFDPGPERSMPRELSELAQSFGAATTTLRERELQLRGLLAQQDLLMQEIHHRVKNNLQIIASLLNLHANRIRQPQARAEFQSARDRVRALATLHRHLYTQGDQFQSIDMRSFLRELCGQLFQAMGEVEGRRIALEIEAPELRILSDQAVPLALLVTELVSNALKYAFPGGRRGRIGITIRAVDDGAEVVIEDDGIGMDAARAAAAAADPDAEDSPGIGTQLVRGFARQLGATLAVETGMNKVGMLQPGGDTDQGGGTRYALRMRLNRHRSAGGGRDEIEPASADAPPRSPEAGSADAIVPDPGASHAGTRHAGAPDAAASPRHGAEHPAWTTSPHG